MFYFVLLSLESRLFPGERWRGSGSGWGKGGMELGGVKRGGNHNQVCHTKEKPIVNQRGGENVSEQKAKSHKDTVNRFHGFD